MELGQTVALRWQHLLDVVCTEYVMLEYLLVLYTLNCSEGFIICGASNVHKRCPSNMVK